MKRLLVAVAVVAAGLPVTAEAGSRPSRAPLVEWAREYRANAHGLPVEPLLDAADAAAAQSVYHFYELLPAGDLDGDGGADVADVRVAQTYDDATDTITSSLRVDARRGRDGHLLWTRAFDSLEEYPYVFFAPVGTAGRPGMVVLSKDAEVAATDAGWAGNGTATVAAYDGAGKRIWSHDSALVGAGAPENDVFTDVHAVGVGDLVAGRAHDLLLENPVQAVVGDPLGVESAWATLVQLQVLDGATGEIHDLGEPIPVLSGEDLYAMVAGDVSGDRLDDVAYADAEGDGLRLRLLRSSDGAEHAAVALPAADYAIPYRAPDVTGDRLADVLVYTHWYDDRPSTKTLVDGGKRRIAWSRPAAGGFFVGDADRKAGAEYVVNEAIYVPGGMGFRLTAVNAAGRTVWTTTRTLRSTGAPDLSDMSVHPAGDVQGDGVVDFRYRMVKARGGPAGREDGFVDGRTGRVRTGLPPNLVPAEGALDGRGADAVAAAARNGVVTVTAWRGDGSARLWETAVSGSRTGSVTFAAALDRDRCADLVYTFGGMQDSTTYVLSGATGAPMWALLRSGATARVVSRPAVRSVKRYARTC